MDSRTIIIGIVTLVIGGGGMIVINSFTVESLKADLRSKEAQIESIQESIKRSHDERDRTNAKIEDLQQASFDIQSKQKAVESLEKEVAAKSKVLEQGKAQWTASVQEMQKSIEQVRFAFRNQIVPEIPLKAGSIKDCRFASYRDGSVTVQHNTGASKLTADQLPPEIAARLRVNFNPTLNIPVDPDAPAVVAETPTTTTSSTPGPSSPSVASTPEPEPPPLEVKDPTKSDAYVSRQQAINELRAFISGAKIKKSTFLEQARTADAKYNEARFYGRSTSQGGLRDKAQASADAIQIQIDQANARILQLQAEMNNIR